jgi:protein TonB
MFELIVKGHRQVPHGDSAPMIMSLALHGAIATLVFVTSVLFVADPVPQLRGISAFVADVLPPPPPPPPAPPTQAETQHIEPQPASRDAAPVEMPPTIEEEEWGARSDVVDTPSVVVGGVLDSPAPEPAPGPAAPPVSPRTAPVRIGGSITPPKLLTRVAPVYPQFAVEGRVEGVVILETVVDPEGRVEDVRVLRSIPLLDQAAMDAVKQWRYAPVLVNGQPVACVLTVTVTFVLREG